MAYADECFLEEAGETVIVCSTCLEDLGDDEATGLRRVRVTEHDTCYICGEPFAVEVD